MESVAPRRYRFPTAESASAVSPWWDVDVLGAPLLSLVCLPRLSRSACGDMHGEEGGYRRDWGGVAEERGVIRKLCFGYSLSLGLRGASTLKLKGKQPFSLPTAH